MTQIQLLSDLHLDLHTSYECEIPVTAPRLLICGDLGRANDPRYTVFLSSLAERRITGEGWEKILVVLGNHEPLASSWDEAKAVIEAVAVESAKNGGSAVEIMWQRRVDIDERMTVLGCTLFSNIPPDKHQIVEDRMPEFGLVEGWTVDKHNAEHVEDVRWLRREIQKCRDEGRKVIVATHHAPLVEGTSPERYEDSPHVSGFATDVLCRSDDSDVHDYQAESFGWEGVDVWAFGHTHKNVDMIVSGIRVVSNQRGGRHPSEPEGTWDPGYVVQV
ncbi:hypothetical protein YB2330_005955 [Saitoella coloradoensis]